ncbi:aminotransferase class V-fold PLP-dependent enzyme [Candidatus Saccharibacteria bacterium]|nr:aminotransferase class V-fold PLP-dependent enzyme [Candidatus Saccharibacteria bacterium]
MRNQLRDILTTAFPDAVVAGHPKHQLSGYLHISFPGLDGERLIFLLESKGVLVASGSACAANKGLRSHVLGAIGMPDEVADGSIRVTLGHLNTPENIEAAGQIMVEQISAEYDRTRK